MPPAPVSAEEQKRRKREWARAHRQKARTTNQAQHRQQYLTNPLVQLVENGNPAVGGSPQAVAAIEAPLSNQEHEEESRRHSPRLHDGHSRPAGNRATRAISEATTVTNRTLSSGRARHDARPGRIERSSSRISRPAEPRETIVVADTSDSSPSSERHQEPSIPGFSALTLDDDDLATSADSSDDSRQQVPSDIESDIESEFAPEPGQFSLSSSPIALTPSVSESLPGNLDLECRPGTPTPIHNSNLRELSPSELSISHLSLMSSSSSSRSSSPSRSFGSSTPTVAAPRSPRSASSPLDFFLQAIDNQETRGGADFLGAQSNVYDQIFRTFFDIGCDCKLLVPIPTTVQ